MLSLGFCTRKTEQRYLRGGWSAPDEWGFKPPFFGRDGLREVFFPLFATPPMASSETARFGALSPGLVHNNPMAALMVTDLN